VAQSEAERDSEALSEDLLAGKVTNIDDFLDKFMVSAPRVLIFLRLQIAVTLVAASYIQFCHFMSLRVVSNFVARHRAT
jgi:hypothetical protein